VIHRLELSVFLSWSGPFATVRSNCVKWAKRLRRGDRARRTTLRSERRRLARFVGPSPTPGRSPEPAHRTHERPTCDRYPEASTGIQSSDREATILLI